MPVLRDNISRSIILLCPDSLSSRATEWPLYKIECWTWGTTGLTQQDNSSMLLKLMALSLLIAIWHAGIFYHAKSPEWSTICADWTGISVFINESKTKVIPKRSKRLHAFSSKGNPDLSAFYDSQARNKILAASAVFVLFCCSCVLSECQIIQMKMKDSLLLLIH